MDIKDLDVVLGKIKELLLNHASDSCITLTLQVHDNHTKFENKKEAGWVKWSKEDEELLCELIRRGVTRKEILREFKAIVGDTNRTDSSIFAKYGSLKEKIKK